MMLKQTFVLAIVKGLITDDKSSKPLGTFCLDDVGWYTVTAEKLLIFIGASIIFLKNSTRPSVYSAPTCYTIAEMSLEVANCCVCGT